MNIRDVYSAKAIALVQNEVASNKIAYLGSLNFTHFGTKSNHETIIRITDKNAITYINSEFESLLNNDYYTKRELNEWGKSLYDEPIN